ncbi:hypothetical protein CUR86_02605 [Salinicola acroporae]|uniref:Single Cache domain-containing protein n=1 Tax=Salinicola acroporae TaxID=1541440 RepID=A0ABT6I1B4_9GAMM|nr:hypothetical protein [Salinicola acroporae]
MTMRRKLWITVGLMWLGMLILVGWMALEKRETLMAERVTSLKSFVASAQTLVERYVQRANDGEFSEDAAKNFARRNLSALDLDGSYVYAFDSDIHLVYHPKREIGTDMSGFRDDNGVYFYRELKALADSPTTARWSTPPPMPMARTYRASTTFATSPSGTGISPPTSMSATSSTPSGPAC